MVQTMAKWIETFPGWQGAPVQLGKLCQQTGSIGLFTGGIQGTGIAAEKVHDLFFLLFDTLAGLEDQGNHHGQLQNRQRAAEQGGDQGQDKQTEEIVPQIGLQKTG